MNFASQTQTNLQASIMAETLIGSEILKIAGEINKLKASGKKIANYTVGDFDNQAFPIPQTLKKLIIEAYEKGATNYPPSTGVPELKQAVLDLYQRELGLVYSQDEVLIASGSRPLIYSTFAALIDPQDKVLYGQPSWNNNHYVHLTRGQAIPILTKPETNYMITAEDVTQHIRSVTLISLCSPQNPTGTIIDRQQLENICAVIVDENKRRKATGEKPVYLMYDAVYWMLTFGRTHEHPVGINPEMRPYTIYIDGISKSLSATGLRVGWAVGPANIIGFMANILGHIGAWAPKPEQIATAAYLNTTDDLATFLEGLKQKLSIRLNMLYNFFQKLKLEGLPVDAIEPMGGMYLSIHVKVEGYKTPAGDLLDSTNAIGAYLLKEADTGLVPFEAFGLTNSGGWFRASVGGVSDAEIEASLERIARAIRKLKND